MKPEDVQRIARESISYQRLNAIGQVRLYASLLMDLWKHDEKHPHTFKNYDECETDHAYYAQALGLPTPYGKGDKLMSALGVTNRSSLDRYKSLLEMPPDLWEKGDKANLSQRVLLRMLQDRYRAKDSQDLTHTPAVVYVLFNPVTKLHKIGITKQIRKRVKVIRKQNHEQVKLMHRIVCEDMATAYEIEQRLHHHFDSKRMSYEWFSLSDEDVKWLSRFYHANQVPSKLAMLRKRAKEIRNEFIRALKIANEDEKKLLNQIVEENAFFWSNYRGILKNNRK